MGTEGTLRLNKQASESNAAAAQAGGADRSRLMGTRLKLIMGALLLGTLPLIVASIILPLRVQSTLEEVGREHLIQAAHGLATLTENEIQRHLETVRSLANVETLVQAIRRRDEGRLQPRELEAVNRQIGLLLRGLAADKYQGMFLCDRTGFVFGGVLKNGDTSAYVHLDIRDRAYLEAARKTLRPVVSDPLQSKVAGLPIMVIAVPVLDERGAFAGLVGLSIELDELAAIIAGQKLGLSGYPFAVDRQGVLVAHPDPARVFKLDLGKMPGTARLAERMRNEETGVEFYVASTGAHKIAAFAPVPIAGWSVAASMETEEFAAPAQALRRIIFAMIGACVVIALVVAFAFAVGLEELKQALATARASEARFKRFASVANETIWDWNLANDELWWSEGLTTSFGYGAHDVGDTAEALFERIREDESPAVAEGVRSCLTGPAWSGEHHFRRSDGTYAYVLHRAVAVRDANGQPIRVIGGMTDISGRRANEEKLTEQATLLDEARDGIMVRDLDDMTRFWSRGAELLYGWSAEEAIGRRSCELLGVDREIFAKAKAQVQSTGQWSATVRKTSKDGTVRTVDCRWTLLRDARGQPKSILTIDTDITEREQMEAKFLRAQRLESIGTLAGGIAHDMNNLLSPIVMGVGLLRLADHCPEDLEVIEHIERSAQRGTQLVKQILSFARGVEGARVAVHVGYVVREVQSMLRSTLPKNISMHVQVPKDVWLITADPTQLNQILMNLCVNARDAMPLGGQLSVSVRNIDLDPHCAPISADVSPGPYVLIEVADTGTGMSKEVMEKLFEPFFTTKELGRGTGLGLSTVMGITRSHGGSVNVYSELGRGSAFKVYLPAACPGLDDGVEEHRPLAAALAQGHGELILLVDDEFTIRSVTSRALEQLGYRVLAAGDGAEALALYHERKGEIALVLTDMMMPLLDGSGLIAALRRLNPQVAIVAASGLSDHNNQIKAAHADIRHFLCKPYTAADLVTVLARALADRRGESSEPGDDPQQA